VFGGRKDNASRGETKGEDHKLGGKGGGASWWEARESILEEPPVTREPLDHAGRGGEGEAC